MDDITENGLFEGGADLGIGRGKLYIKNMSDYNKEIEKSFPDKKPDNRILSVVLGVATETPDITTILVTKDINLRMKARSLGLLVEDYITDKVVNIDAFSEEELEIEGVDADLIDKLYNTPMELILMSSP